MKSTRTVYSLILLSLPHLLNAASSSCGNSMQGWQVRQKGCARSKLKRDVTLEPSHELLESLDAEALKFEACLTYTESLNNRRNLHTDLLNLASRVGSQQGSSSEGAPSLRLALTKPLNLPKSAKLLTQQSLQSSDNESTFDPFAVQHWVLCHEETWEKTEDAVTHKFGFMNVQGAQRRAETEYSLPRKTLTLAEQAARIQLFLALCTESVEQTEGLMNSHVALTHKTLTSIEDETPIHHERLGRAWINEQLEGYGRELLACENRSLSSMVGLENIEQINRELNNINNEISYFKSRLATLDQIDGYAQSSTPTSSTYKLVLNNGNYSEGKRTISVKHNDGMLDAHAHISTVKEQLDTLKQRKEELKNALNLQQKTAYREAYRIRALIDGFKLHAAQNSMPIPSENEIIQQIFAEELFPIADRSIFHSLLANILRTIEDPSPTTGLRSYLGNYEPRTVSSFRTTPYQMQPEHDEVTTQAPNTEWEKLLTTLHTQAIAHLKSAICQPKTNDTEKKAFEANLIELSHINELENLYSAQPQDDSSLINQPSSSNN